MAVKKACASCEREGAGQLGARGRAGRARGTRRRRAHGRQGEEDGEVRCEDPAAAPSAACSIREREKAHAPARRPQARLVAGPLDELLIHRVAPHARVCRRERRAEDDLWRDARGQLERRPARRTRRGGGGSAPAPATPTGPPCACCTPTQSARSSPRATRRTRGRRGARRWTRPRRRARAAWSRCGERAGEGAREGARERELLEICELAALPGRARADERARRASLGAR